LKDYQDEKNLEKEKENEKEKIEEKIEEEKHKQKEEGMDKEKKKEKGKEREKSKEKEKEKISGPKDKIMDTSKPENLEILDFETFKESKKDLTRKDTKEIKKESSRKESKDIKEHSRKETRDHLTKEVLTGNPDKVVWEGRVSMPSVSKFSSKVFQLQGTSTDWGTILNDSLVVQGRINPEVVVDYLKQVFFFFFFF